MVGGFEHDQKTHRVLGQKSERQGTNIMVKNDKATKGRVKPKSNLAGSDVRDLWDLMS